MSSVKPTTFSGDPLRFRYYDMDVSQRISDWSTPLFDNDPTPGKALAILICLLVSPILLTIGFMDATFTIIACPLTWIMNQIYYYTQGNQPRTRATSPQPPPVRVLIGPRASGQADQTEQLERVTTPRRIGNLFSSIWKG